VAQRLISQDNVVAMVGPDASSCAIPALIVAETFKCPMILPGHHEFKDHLDEEGKPKKYVFRACFIDPFEARVLAKFVLNNIKAKTAAVLFDVASEARTARPTFSRRSLSKTVEKSSPSKPTRPGTVTFPRS